MPQFVQPIILEPILVERIWGVTSLEPWHTATEPLGKPIGEIWLTAETCIAANGPAAGQSLADLTTLAPTEFGDPTAEGFPLLLKLLFPREKLSVQVHPNDQQAQTLGMPRGKTECWYVLSAEPGAAVAVGFREPLTNAQIKAAIADGSIEAKLRMIPVKAGDMIFVDAGTVHAIGPGMVVLETQQYSDTTYRLWDYGRPRELHIEAGVDVTRTETAAGLVDPVPMEGFTRLVSAPYFAVDRFSLDAEADKPLDAEGKLQILVALDDGASLLIEQNGGSQSVALPRGKAVLLPKSLASASLRTSSTGAPSEVIRILQP